MERDEWLAWYEARGLATIPVVPCGKRPLRAGWRTPTPNAWLDASPDANIGVLCGAASGGLVVLDFDTLDGVREASGMRPEELAVHTLVAKTARGWHVYARAPDARTNSPWKGLDVRAEGSMVVAPPSVHGSGARYAFVRLAAAIAPLSALPFDLQPDVPEDDGVVEIDWPAVEELVAAQAPKLREHWTRLKAPCGRFDRSRADFAIASCLSEAGYGAEVIAAILESLPGSKAQERGRQYALRTAIRARDRRT